LCIGGSGTAHNRGYQKPFGFNGIASLSRIGQFAPPYCRPESEAAVETHSSAAVAAIPAQLISVGDAVEQVAIILLAKYRLRPAKCKPVVLRTSES